MFMTNYVVPLFNADNGAKDLCRILRVPNFYHKKDIDNPFLCKKTYESKALYLQDNFHNLITERFNRFKEDFSLVDPKESRKIEKLYAMSPRTNKYTAEQLAYRIGNPTRCGKGWKVKCIAHNENEPSLFIAEGEKVPVVWHCFGGCSGERILFEFKERGLW
jgi:hypothetical protein